MAIDPEPVTQARYVVAVGQVIEVVVGTAIAVQPYVEQTAVPSV